MAMSENLVISSSESGYPRNPDSCHSGTSEGFNCANDMVSNNNQKNEQLNELSQMESLKSRSGGDDVDDDADVDAIEDDWFTKLTSSKELARGDAASCGLNCGRFPLLSDEDFDFKERTMRSLRMGLRKIWRRDSATITAEDPTYKVAYLGNVLTGWAKGEGCVDKPLSTLWKNYNCSTKPDMQMKISVTQSGLKAVTKEHGLIEYWSHRITYCAVPSALPRIFCWVYRHEGRKLKQELRCHAVLCSKESVAARMADTLRLRLTQALLDFKKDKILRQNARLSLANSVYENPSLPRRKILLSTGSHNYKPPLERSKSAPKLMPIEENLEEEESTPRARRKTSGNGSGREQQEVENEGSDESDAREKKSNVEDKCEYKLANLNFVKKLCSSIENLVESTSNYSKKLLTERKTSKDLHPTLKSSGESLMRKVCSEKESITAGNKGRTKKNVCFGMREAESWREPAKCMEYKRLDEEEGKEQRSGADFVMEARDLESDEGSNSLQSMSSCCSDVSSLVTSSSDKSIELSFKSDEEELADTPRDHETSAERLHAYLIDYEETVLDMAAKVILHPTGQQTCSLDVEEDVASDESGYAELPDSLVRAVNVDRKEKDLPHHKIIKSIMLRPGRAKPSCLHV